MTKTIIVGAGIAGLWIADQLSDSNITVLEKEDHVGGRIITSAKHGYEIGAGRIDLRDHRRIMALIKRFGLTTFKHGGHTLWKGLQDAEPGPNHFAAIWAPLIALFATLDPKILARSTLRELATAVLGSKKADALLIQFPYRAELDTLRADLAIHSFQAEMSGTKPFGGVVGGLSSITKALAASCRSKGVRFIMQTTVTDVTYDGRTYTVQTQSGRSLKAGRVILALPATILQTLPFLRSFRPLQYLHMKPLTRIYAKTVGPWPFKDRIVTDSPLRYIIPIRPAEGIVMISYTESQDTRAFLGMQGADLVTALTVELRRLFPSMTIDIEWARAYEWSDGCTYWLPGNYDPVAAGQNALQPFPTTMPHLHLVGESFSTRQAWMEGALEHAASLISLIR
jgi:monoamine oxidase